MRVSATNSPAPWGVVAAALIIGLAILPRAADGRRIFVPRDHKQLQAAIDAAAPGDTVWVAAGTYQGPFILKKPLVIFGDGGSEATILDGGDSVRVLHIEGVARASILGFRIQRGKAPGGGGIYCLHDSMLQIGSCDIRSNWEAGVAAWQSGPIQIIDTEISENKGSGISANGSKLQLTRVKLRENRGFSGGGVSLVSSELMVARDCTFDRNRAEGGTGGGLNADSSSARISSCTFSGNTSAVAGGALAVVNGSDLTVRKGRFTSNRAASGGGLLVDRSSLILDYSVFDKNRATAAGAAVQILGRKTAGVNPILNNITYYRNGTDGEGAAIFLQQVSPEIRHCIFVVDSTEKNRAVLELDGAPRYECNMLHTLGGTPAGATPSANTLVADPMFCDPENGDFHVRNLSPALLASCGKIGALGKGCASFRMLPGR
jgi:nitrous oxidase accessory protein NosD